MPHQCVRCNTFYDDGNEAILKGCSCGAKLFFFIRKERLEQIRKAAEEAPPVSEEERKQIESDVFDVLGVKEPDEPVVLDLESVRVLKPGKYEIDLVQLFKGEPLIFKLADGKYIIDIAETFRRLRKDKK
ncbi:MAG: Zn-ribbon containing protein [Candidatus Woesearchaeota archaeon]